MSTVTATSLPLSGAPTGAASLRLATDARFFALVASFYVIVALVGFIPSSVQKIADVAAGQRPTFPPVLHVHAAAMAGWLLLLAAQATHAAADRRAMHRTLAWASLVLVPTMLVSGLGLVPTVFHSVWRLDPEAAAPLRSLVTNLTLLQYRALSVFAVLFAWALWVRKSDSATHRRLMLLATSTPLLAAVDRIAWLPTTMPDSPLSLELYGVLLVLPMLAHDLITQRCVPRAYAIWAGVSLPWVIATHTLWGTAGWAAIVPKLMGEAG